jgi:hypothetical protein
MPIYLICYLLVSFLVCLPRSVFLKGTVVTFLFGCILKKKKKTKVECIYKINIDVLIKHFKI